MKRREENPRSPRQDKTTQHAPLSATQNIQSQLVTVTKEKDTVSNGASQVKQPSIHPEIQPVYLSPELILSEHVVSGTRALKILIARVATINNLALDIFASKLHDGRPVETLDTIAVKVNLDELVNSKDSASRGDGKTAGSGKLGERIGNPIIASPLGVLEHHRGGRDDTIGKVGVADLGHDDTGQEVGDVLDVLRGGADKDPALGWVRLNAVADAAHLGASLGAIADNDVPVEPIRTGTRRDG